jgi:CheY-like chemotaxis protein
MNGRVWMESEPGHGSTFHFTARLERSNGDSERRPAVDPAKLRGLRVLVVDDNATNRRILGEMLTNWRLDPTVVDGAPAALAALDVAQRQSRPFHMVLLDAQMPGTDGYTLARRITRDRDGAGPTLIMLTSAGHEPARARSAGIHAALLKPVKQSDLLDAIVTTLGGKSVARGEARRAAREPRPRKLRVLLVEDNRVNRTMAIRILEKRGHAVTWAENGQEALKEIATARRTRHRGRSQSAAFDVVLMDVQMPVMNGLEATMQIRDGERASGQHVPIVAMTAHAMRGDRERCLAAGMDAYLVKPIQAEELIAAVESIAVAAAESAAESVKTAGEKRAAAAAETTTSVQASNGDGLREAFLARVDGDVELAREMAQLFLEDRGAMMNRVDRAIAASDKEGLRFAAHALALRLEKGAWSGELADAEATWDSLRAEIDRVAEALQTIGQPAPTKKAKKPVRPRGAGTKKNRAGKSKRGRSR